MPVTPQAAPGAPNPAAPPPGPMGAPMAQASSNEGSRQIGMVQVETAMQMLERAVAALHANTPEGKAALDALKILSKVFDRSKSQDLVPAQIAEMARAQQQSPIAQMMAGGGQPQGAPMQ